MTQPRAHIHELRDRLENTDESLLKALAGAINRLEKSFPEQWHFLMEFIQNADDCRSSSFSLRLSEDEILILNDGRPFDFEDVESLCNVGNSSKTHPDKGEDYIGYLGVGFKSIFLISTNPKIRSGDYRFEFKKRAWDDPDSIPWQISPLWLEDDSTSIPAGFNTLFKIPLSEEISDTAASKLTEELGADQVTDRTVLFLRNLEYIELIDENEDTAKSISKKKDRSEEDYRIIEIETSENGESHTNRWLVFSAISDIPDQVKNDTMTKRWERDQLDNREVMVAFRIDDQEELVKEEGTAHMGVFSFLPLKEVPSGLNFLIQADFLTAPGRETIHRDAAWNRWLARQVYNLIVNQVIPTFKENEKWRSDFTKVLFPNEGGHTLFNEEIHQELRAYLTESPVLLNAVGGFAKASDCVNVDPEIGDLISKQEFDKLYSGKSRLHVDCETVWELESEMVDGPSYSSTRGVSNDMRQLLKLKAEANHLDFFLRFYQLLDEWADSTLQGSRINRDPIALTTDWDLEVPRDVFIVVEGLSIPSEMESEITELHPDLQGTSESEVLVKLGANVIDEQELDELQTTDDVLVSDDWDRLTDEQRMGRTAKSLDLYLNHKIDPSELEHLELLSKVGEWSDPEDLVLPAEFRPDHALETLYQNGFITSELAFVSTDYLSGDFDVQAWRDFLLRLGVEDGLHKPSIVEQVAIESAKKVEEDEGRDVTVLPRHEEREGYDIESGSRLIEVKGSENEFPRINLTRKQFSRLKADKDRYYVYVVRNALSRPHLSIIKAERFLDVDRSVRVDYSELQRILDDEFALL